MIASKCAAALVIAVSAALVTAPGFAADDTTAAPKGAAVTVLKAAKACFPDIVDVSGILIPRDEIAVRPERPGLKVADILVEPGQTVTAGQAMARLGLPEGGTTTIQAPQAGLVSKSSAIVGAVASAKGEPLFTIIAKNDFDLVGQVPTEDLARLARDQSAQIKIVGAGDMTGTVHRVAPTVEPNSQLGQVFIAVDSTQHLLVNASGRALIKAGESCGISVPLSAVLYSSAGTVVQVVKQQQVETRRVELGLMSAGQIEIRDGLSEGDVIVARAGALLREGDAVRPIPVQAK